MPFVHQPPKLAEFILKRTTHTDVRYAALGDFAEIFSHLADVEGIRSARWWYWTQVLKSVPTFLIDSFFWKIIMLQNYLKVALRSLAKNKMYSAVNIAGLSVGIASFLMISLFVNDELSYDDFHENADNVYRLAYLNRMGPNLPVAPLDEFQAWGSAPVGPALVEMYPEIQEAVRFSGRHQLLLARDDQSFLEEDYFYVDPNVFSMFDFNLLKGDPATALLQPGSIVLSETAVIRYFGNEDPIGQMLTISNDSTITVTGVMEDVPENSHLEFDMLLSMSTFEQNSPDYVFQSYGYVDFFTYIRLHEEASIDALAEKMPEFFSRTTSADETEVDLRRDYAFENLRDAYFSPTGGSLKPGPTGNPANLVIFSAIAIFILLIACVNYMNLSTARSSERAKEIGIRKVVGAQIQSLIGQFLAESFVFVFIAVGGAFLLAAMTIPAFASLSGKSFTIASLIAPKMLATGVGVALLVGLLAGSYPALILSRFKPVSVLKGSFVMSKSGAALRKGLVVLQFGITFALIAGSITVYSQLDYMQNRGLGFEKEQMMVIDFGFDDAVLDHVENVRETFLKHPSVSKMALARTVPGGYFPQAGTMLEMENGEMELRIFNIFQIGHDYIPHFGLEMVAGRAYSRDFESDLQEALVVNEAAVRDMGYASAEEAVGKRFAQWGREGVIVGVAKDFHYQSLQSRIEPLSLSLSPQSTKLIVLKLSGDNIVEAVEDLKATYASIVPHRPFLYRFLDEAFDSQYRAETRFGTILSVFSSLAIFIACLGLLGLTAAVTVQRQKEIGVRKVLGASAGRIVVLLSKEFAILVVLAALLATPLVYIGMTSWLDGFAFRTSMSVWTFVQAGSTALAIAMFAMNYQTIRAALANPVDSLRSD